MRKNAVQESAFWKEEYEKEEGVLAGEQEDGVGRHMFQRRNKSDLFTSSRSPGSVVSVCSRRHNV
jgi:hypothetical protein|tara:strand:+ start:186 stop:380 length:195 start_codon:yes stop_codon:yes gene_type:complete